MEGGGRRSDPATILPLPPPVAPRTQLSRKRPSLAWAAVERVADPDPDPGGADPDPDPDPDVWELFRRYNQLYFGGALSGFAVQWSTPRMTSSTGACTFGKAGNIITLSKPMLKSRPSADLKNTLLHEMIHAVLFVKLEKRDHGSHGPRFRAWMDAINSCSITDHQRPAQGYNITIHHDFRQEEVTIKGFQWKCESCGDLLVRAMNQGPPSLVCCIENVGNEITCGNVLCHWHNHKMSCGGNYARMNKPQDILGQRRVSKASSGAQRLLCSMPKESKTPGAAQRSTEHKELAVASAWLNYYESEGSDISVEPLINKRIERRKRKKTQMSSSRVGKRGTNASSSTFVHAGDSKSNGLLHCKNAKQTPQAPCLDIVIADTGEPNYALGILRTAIHHRGATDFREPADLGGWGRCRQPQRRCVRRRELLGREQHHRLGRRFPQRHSC